MTALQVRRFKPWLLALRPKTLTAAFVPVMVATALVKAEGHQVKWWISFFALASALFIQIGTNFVNDAIDFKKGADGEGRIGPQRVTSGGLLSSRQVLIAAAFTFLLALICGIPLVIQGGWPIVVIGLVSILLGYCYTGGPFPLAYLGLGDLFVILFFGLVAVVGTYFLYTQTVSAGAWMAGLQIGCLATVLIAINNLRDSAQDAKVGKRTLAVRFGIGFARAEIFILVMAPFAIGWYWFAIGQSHAAVMPLFAVPIARRLLVGIFTSPPGPIYNRYLALSALLQMSFGLLLAGALWVK